MSDPTQEDVHRALVGVTSNAIYYPDPSVMLGRDTGLLRGKIVDAVINLYEPALQAARAEAWDDGHHNGWLDREAGPRGITALNPYRQGADA